jgi:hypothetical protein
VGGPSSKVWSQIRHLLPADASGLLDGSFYSPLVQNHSKLCRITLKALSTSRIERYKALCSPNLISPDGCLTAADVVQAHSHSFSGRIFQSSLKQFTGFAFSSAVYTSWCLFFLGLPPHLTLHNQTHQPGFDYPVQCCLGKHGVHTVPLLDAGGCHASSNCPSTYAARMKRHSFIARVVNQAAKEAGLNVHSEPDTYGLLLGEFTKADCRRLFPKQGSRAYEEKFKAVLNALDLVASPACTIPESEKVAYVRTRMDALPQLTKNQFKGLRVDSSIVDPSTNETMWVDVSAIQTSAASNVGSELKSVGQQVTSTSTLFEIPDYVKAAPSPSLLKREAEKHHKYSRLIIVAQKQTVEKKRLKTPKFAPFIVSAFGDFAPEAIQLRGTQTRWVLHPRASQEVQTKVQVTHATCLSGRSWTYVTHSRASSR